MKIQALLEKRATVVGNMRTLTDTVSTETRDFTEKEASNFDSWKTELKTLDGNIERAQVLAEAERSAPVDPARTRRGNDGSFEEQCRSFSLCAAIAAQLEPRSVDAGREYEISQELARRDGKEARGLLVPHEVFHERRALLTSNTGANLYPERHRDDLYIDRLRENLRVGALGATVLSGLKGVQDIPRMVGSVTGYWVGEHADITPSDAVFDSVQMAPKTVGAETEYSRRMIINASPDIENLMRRDLAQVLGTAIDYQAINGTGAGDLPTGILNSVGTAELDFDGNNPGYYTNLLKFVTELSTDNALSGKLAWLVNPLTYSLLRRVVRESTEVPLMDRGDRLLDYPIAQTNHMPSDTGAANDESKFIFGNWQDLIIGYWSSVDILVNPYHTDVYSKGGVKINAMQDVDIAVRHPESFVIGKGLNSY